MTYPDSFYKEGKRPIIANVKERERFTDAYASRLRCRYCKNTLDNCMCPMGVPDDCDD